MKRSVALLGRNGRVSKDCEFRLQTSETLIEVAATRLMLNRITQPISRDHRHTLKPTDQSAPEPII